MKKRKNWFSEINNWDRDKQWKWALKGQGILSAIALDALANNAAVGEENAFMEAFQVQKRWLPRTDAIEALGIIGTPLAKDLLVEIISLSKQRMVRRYAITELIEFQDDRWMEFKPKTATRSDFWKSMDAYYRYWEDDISLEQLHELSRKYSTVVWDNWHWLGNVTESE